MAIGTEDIIGPTQTTLTNLLNSVINFLPNIIQAVILFVIGIVIAGLASRITKNLLNRIHSDKWAKENGLENVILHTNLSKSIPFVVKWYLLLVFGNQIAASLKLTALASFLNTFILAIPNVLVGVIIILIGMIMGHLFNEVIKKKNVIFSEIISGAVYFTVVYFSIVLALPKFGITNTEILSNAFNYIVAGLSAGIAIAIGIGFGFALKDPIKDMLIGRIKKKR